MEARISSLQNLSSNLTPKKCSLGFNADHVATIRQLRYTPYPDLLTHCNIAMDAGADFITVHLREDRRHVNDNDILLINQEFAGNFNLEISCNQQIVQFAQKIAPTKICLVPEKRSELTTEGGLAIQSETLRKKIKPIISQLQKVGAEISLFIEPDIALLPIVIELGADAIELHTGQYANAHNPSNNKKELARIKKMAKTAAAKKIKVHAGHGLFLGNLQPIAAICEICELNIGHAIVADSLELSLAGAISQYRKTIDQARTKCK